MEMLGRRVRVRHDAESDLGRYHAGKSGRIEQFSRDPNTMEMREYTVSLDSGASLVPLAPTELDFLD